MREILFKAKRLDNGKWGAGYYVKKTKWHHISDEYVKTEKHYICVNMISSEDSYIDMVEVNPDTLCQYTGLTDKNGNKIWENDILFDDEYKSLVRWDESVARFVIDDYGTKGCVMEYGFDEDAGGYGVVDTNGFDDFCDDAHMIFEVIGNIFDNPELLGV